jgi:hypothetical protein
MKPTQMNNYRETRNQWLTALLDRTQELPIQLARLDVEIGIVREALQAREAARTRAFPRIASLSSMVVGDGTSPSRPNCHLARPRARKHLGHLVGSAKSSPEASR